MADSPFLQCIKAQVGKPYTWGGASPTTGFDCSGLVNYCLGNTGGGHGPTAADLQKTYPKIDASQAEPGDLTTYGNPAYHVEVYIGNGQEIGADNAGSPVRVEQVWGNPEYHSLSMVVKASGPGAGGGTTQAGGCSPTDIECQLGQIIPDTIKALLDIIFPGMSPGAFVLRLLEVVAGGVLIGFGVHSLLRLAAGRSEATSPVRAVRREASKVSQQVSTVRQRKAKETQARLRKQKAALRRQQRTAGG